MFKSALALFLLSACGTLPNPAPSPSPSPLPTECSNQTFTFTGVPNAKTYVLFDLNTDGTRANTGQGGNGNLGNSAQIGADCCRDDSIPIISGFIPDNNSHYLGIFAYGIGGIEIPGNPIATFQLNAAIRNVCE